MDDNTKQRREEELFERALSLRSKDLRLGYLKGACGDDLALYGRLVDLVEAHGGDDNFIKTVTFEGPADSDFDRGNTSEGYKDMGGRCIDSFSKH